MNDCNLKATLFSKTRKALDGYTAADHALELHIGRGDLDGIRKVRAARYNRFCALWDVIEAAELETEYEAWKEAQA